MNSKGVYSGFATDRDEIIGMQFLFGDIDGCKNHRETLIRFSCGNSYRMTKDGWIHSKGR